MEVSLAVQQRCLAAPVCGPGVARLLTTVLELHRLRVGNWVTGVWSGTDEAGSSAWWGAGCGGGAVASLLFLEITSGEDQGFPEVGVALQPYPHSKTKMKVPKSSQAAGRTPEHRSEGTLRPVLRGKHSDPKPPCVQPSSSGGSDLTRPHQVSSRKPEITRGENANSGSSV